MHDRLGELVQQFRKLIAQCHGHEFNSTDEFVRGMPSDVWLRKVSCRPICAWNQRQVILEESSGMRFIMFNKITGDFVFLGRDMNEALENFLFQDPRRLFIIDDEDGVCTDLPLMDEEDPLST